MQDILKIPSSDAAIAEATERGKAMSEAEFSEMKVRWYNERKGSLSGEDCPVCRNKGMIASLGEDGAEYVRECSCMKRRRYVQALGRSGLADLCGIYTFDSFTAGEEWQRTAKERAQAYAASDRGWLMVFGQSGCGKTHLCTAVCDALLRRGCTVKYVLWRSLVQKMQATRFSESYGGILEELMRYDAVYIDDFLKCPDRSRLGSELPYAFEVINRLYCSQKSRLIVSSELFLEEIGALDAAVAGRIAERAAGSMIQIRRGAERNYRFAGGGQPEG